MSGKKIKIDNKEKALNESMEIFAMRINDAIKNYLIALNTAGVTEDTAKRLIKKLLEGVTISIDEA